MQSSRPVRISKRKLFRLNRLQNFFLRFVLLCRFFFGKKVQKILYIKQILRKTCILCSKTNQFRIQVCNLQYQHGIFRNRKPLLCPEFPQRINISCGKCERRAKIIRQKTEQYQRSALFPSKRTISRFRLPV